MKLFYQIFTKKTILSILIVQCSILSFATTYYVSNSGNDSNSGLTTILAWKTLVHVNALKFKAGDQILFQKGDTFYGTITVKNSGSAGNPITYGAYGTGENPIITGFTTVTAWTNLGGNIWESTSAVSTLSTCNMVVINGVNTPMGRYPNADAANGGYLTYQSHSGKTSITSSSLTGTTDWTGAEVVVRTVQWILDRSFVTSQSGNTLTYSPYVSTFTPTDGFGFFIQNDTRTLDQQNEWYYNPSTKKIRVYSTSIPTNIQVASQDVLATIHAAFITIDGLSFTGANRYSILTEYGGLRDIILKNCTVNFSGIEGIQLGTPYSTIENCIISNSNSTGVNLIYDVEYSTIRNNTIQNTGIYPGMGETGVSGRVGILKANSYKGLIIEYNRIIKTGYNGIYFSGDSALIKNNFIDTFCTVLQDGGGIYTGGLSYGNVITGNIVLNGIGAFAGTNSTSYTPANGIYMDDNAKNVEITDNTMANCAGNGILLHNASYITITSNTVYNNKIQFYTQDDATNDAITNCLLTNNIFLSKDANQYVVNLITLQATLPTMGTFDNNYYARPIDDNQTFYLQPNGWSNPLYHYTLTQWQAYSGQDANSHKSPQAITMTDDLQFEYNATTTAKTVTLSRPMIDVKGTKYAISVTLQPFTSVVLMKDLTPVVVPDAPTSVIATAGNASASVTFSAPANNGGSAITGYTVTSIPSGGVDSNAGSTSLNHAITGLTNGTSYTFTVKATNSVGTSVASMASNSVTPKALTATTFTFTGPSSGSLNSASTIFTVTPNNLYKGTITITPTGTGSAGLSAKVLTFSNSSAAQTYTITPTVAGSITLTATNNGSLTNPDNLTYSANAIVPDAPTSVVATAGDASASVTFVATTNNGGSAITGYTVTSNPTGGTDINAGSTSLNHTISGLTNGTSYKFKVKATNSVGTSSFSVASNSTTIAKGKKNLDHVKKMVVFPNPCHGHFTVRFSEIPISESRIEVLNLSGRKVTSQIIKGISQEIDLSGQAPGMYFVKSIQGSIEKIDKLVIQH